MQQLSEKDAKRLADAWAEREGSLLAAEVEVMRQQGVAYQTPRADHTARVLDAQGVAPLVAPLVAPQGYAPPQGVPWQGATLQGVPAAADSAAVRGSKRARQRRVTAIVGFAAAACFIVIALIVGVPAMLQPSTGAHQGETAAEPGETAAEPGETAAEPGITEPFDSQAMPLSFVLPAGYKVAATDFDNGVSLYALESPSHGDVQMAVCPADEDGGNAGAEVPAMAVPKMDMVIIDGTAVPAKVDDSFMLLAFEHKGMSYTLSSRDDMGALVAFYRSIVRTSV